MKKRILFGTLMVALVVGLFWLDWWLEAAEVPRLGPSGLPLKGLPIAIAAVGLVAAAFVEIYRMSAVAGVLPLPRTGLFGALLLGTLPFWWQFVGLAPPTGAEVLVVTGLLVMFLFAEQMVRNRVADAFRRLAVTSLAMLYLGVGMAMMLQIRISFGVPALVLFLGAVKFTDIGAFFTGSALGRHKMIPWLSPGKSWEGLAGGLALAAAMGVLVASVLGMDVPWWGAAVIATIAGLAGQFGDLCESLLKRSTGMKDSGVLVPNFGGVLDIIDSPLLASIVTYPLLAMTIPA